ncbi:hypothetical protein J3R30DRAFT_919084 [Lentinula aciculospora]|uniref:Uncharacterized protein n=1 Tax=Lentinula aciculospora TaxID=153920 RepID=A0A9W9DW96_9AGAR|nr:hypothetical protein J3R30DRAFT_919084 [Lentinula aciculospora]
MVPKLRNSVAVTEGNRSQSTSSIGSTLSHFSVVSTKTVSAGLLYPDNPPRSQTVLQSPPFINLQTPPPSDDTAPVSPVTQQLPSKSSMLHPSVAPPSQLPSLSLDPLDVYTANQYLSTTPSMSTLGAWSNVPHGNSDTISSRPSGSMSRVYLPPTAHSKPKSIPSSHVNPSTRVSPESSRATSKCSFPQQAREGNLLVASRIAISSEYPPTPLHTEGPVVHRVTSPSVKSTVYAQPAELSNTVDAMSFASEDNLPQSSLSSTGPSYGQRYAFNTRPISSNISPSSPFSLPVDLSGPNAHSHSPLGSSPTHPPTVNLKRLLSKPAPAGNSSASESEGVVTTIDSRAVRRIERIEEKHEKQRIESSSRERTLESDAECAPNFVSSRERDRTRKTEWEAERRMLKERTSSHRRPTTSQSTDSSQTKERTRFGGLVRSASWSRSREREGTGQTGKKTKNVLKRRPSATSVASPLDASTMKEFPYSSFAPAYTGSIIHATQQMTSSGNLMPPSAGQSSSRGSSPAPQNKRRSFIPHSALLKQGLVSDDDASTLSGTTPAKEIMLAYKQQQERERNREKERNERAREKQRERDLWQQEEKERQQRGSEDRVSLSVPRNDGSIPSAKSSSSKNPPLAGVEHQSSASAPNLGAASVINDSSLSTNQLPSRPERICSEARGVLWPLKPSKSRIRFFPIFRGVLRTW